MFRDFWGQWKVYLGYIYLGSVLHGFMQGMWNSRFVVVGGAYVIWEVVFLWTSTLVCFNTIVFIMTPILLLSFCAVLLHLSKY